MKFEEKCRKHWQQLGIDGLDALRDHIKAIFRKHEHQQYILADIYELVFPEWEQIQKINGYPEAGNDLWKFICKLFIDFDQKHHPKCFAGGAWMNKGFSVNKNLSPWEISFESCQVVMK